MNDWKNIETKVILGSGKTQNRPVAIEAIFTPIEFNLYRRITKYIFIRDLQTNQVTLRINTSPPLREEIFEELRKKFPGAKTLHAATIPDKENSNIPCIEINVPYQKLAQTLLEINQTEDHIFRIKPDSIDNFVNGICETVVSKAVGIKTIPGKPKGLF